MVFIIGGFIWDIPILFFAYVLFWGPNDQGPKSYDDRESPLPTVFPVLATSWCCQAGIPGLNCSQRGGAGLRVKGTDEFSGGYTS